MAIDSIDILELGTDIKSSWTFNNGDLVLVDNEVNLVQAMLNRLNCEYDSLNAYYLEYGSSISSFLGFRSEKETLEFIKIEIGATLEQDPRITDFEVNTDYNKQKQVMIDINVKFNDDSDLSLSLVLDEEGTILLANDDLSAEEED